MFKCIGYRLVLWASDRVVCESPLVFCFNAASCFFFFFFFSSRRRHTRYIGDWSSDVCSSDLLGGVLFVDSADKAARFIWLCDAFNVPLLYLADVPGFMIGTKVERQGIIRAGAKMIAAV